jgi:hypothetical protein
MMFDQQLGAPSLMEYRDWGFVTWVSGLPIVPTACIGYTAPHCVLDYVSSEVIVEFAGASVRADYRGDERVADYFTHKHNADYNAPEST